MKKILISSDPNGRFDLLLQKIHELHNKNKFDFMIFVGQVSPSYSASIFNELKNKKLSFPLPSYFIDCSNMSGVFGVLHGEGFEIVPNLFYLGNHGMKQIQGIKIAYLSGKVQKTNELSTYGGNIYEIPKIEVKNFIISYQDKEIDILLTNEWAQQYISLQGCTPSKSQVISQVCYQLSPRYHISAGGTKYLRLPAFKGRKGNPTHFINVAEIKQAIPKDKYLVAIQINPSIKEILDDLAYNPLIKAIDWNVVQNQQPKTLVQNQTIKIGKKKVEQNNILDKSSFIMFEGFPQQTPNSQITQFLQKWGEVKQIEVFKKLKGNKKTGIVRFVNMKDAEICLKDSGKYSLYQSRIKFQVKQQNQKYRLKDCFLCIQNSKFEKNLLVYKGKFCFVCLDKGPVVDYHIQIVPINHVSSTEELQQQQQQQLSQFKILYQNYFVGLGYTFICVQRYMNLSAEINHAILHCIPLKMSEQEVLSRFKEANFQNKFGFEPLEKTQNSKNDSPFYILLNINSHKFIKNVDRKDKRFQQGRQIVCEIINKPERLNWRDCEVGEAKIKDQAEALKKVVG